MPYSTQASQKLYDYFLGRFRTYFVERPLRDNDVAQDAKLNVRKLGGNIERWREIGAGPEPAFENSWVNVAGGNETAAFAKDPFNFIHLKGVVKDGTVGSTIFTLPVPYRPALEEVFAVWSFASGTPTLGRVNIRTGGAVFFDSGGVEFVSLSGINFKSVTEK